MGADDCDIYVRIRRCACVRARATVQSIVVVVVVVFSLLCM